MEAWPGLPAASGAYSLTATDRNGAEVISLSFGLAEVADAPGKSSHFAFTVPVQEGWAGSVANITFSGGRRASRLSGDTLRLVGVTSGRRQRRDYRERPEFPKTAAWSTRCTTCPPST